MVDDKKSMGVWVRKDGSKRLWAYFVTFGLVELALLFFGFKWAFYGFGFQRFLGWFLVFCGVFGFLYLFFGEFIMDQLNSVVYR